MRFSPVDPPRRFRAGRRAEVEMSDTGRLALDADEQPAERLERPFSRNGGPGGREI